MTNADFLAAVRDAIRDAVPDKDIQMLTVEVDDPQIPPVIRVYCGGWFSVDEIDAIVNAQWDTIEKWPGHCVHVEVRKGSL